MAKSISATQKKKRGRPVNPGGRRVSLPIAFAPRLVVEIDALAAKEAITRSEAVRRLVEASLHPHAGAAAPSAPAPTAPPLAKLQAAAARGGLLKVIPAGSSWAALLASLTPGGKPLADCTRAEVDDVVAYLDGLLAALRTHALTAAPVYGGAKSTAKR